MPPFITKERGRQFNSNHQYKCSTVSEISDQPNLRQYNSAKDN